MRRGSRLLEQSQCESTAIDKDSGQDKLTWASTRNHEENQRDAKARINPRIPAFLNFGVKSVMKKRTRDTDFLSIRFGVAKALVLVALILMLSTMSSGSVQAFKTGQSASIVLGQSTFTTNTCRAPTPSGLCNPLDSEFDSSGTLWVVDTFNCRVLEFTPPFATDENASLVIGQPNLVASTCSQTQNGLFSPSALTFDAKGNMWVLDQGGCRVLEFNLPFSNGESASLVIGEPDFTTRLCSGGQNGLSFPQDAAFDSSGDLWVADNGGSRVLEFLPPFVNNENASLVIGQQGFTTFACSGSQSGLCFPGSVKFDSSGNLWVSDGGNNRVLRFNSPFSNGENASVVIGQSSFTTNICYTTQSGLCRPSGLAFDSKGNLWIADLYNSRILKFKTPFSNGESAVLVIGQSNFTDGAGTCTTTQGGLCNPTNLVFDGRGNLWLADHNNNRIVAFANHHGV